MNGETVVYEHKDGEPIDFSDDGMPDSSFVNVNLERVEFTDVNMSTVSFDRANMECALFNAVDL
ncbi:MAG TPA: hypothetical protein DD392_00640, partial [Ruminococcus sp.]|nr:hypothetical protein [Ruminococcus sp.]